MTFWCFMQKQLPFIAAANITNTSLTSSFLAVPEGFALEFWNCLKLAAVCFAILRCCGAAADPQETPHTSALSDHCCYQRQKSLILITGYRLCNAEKDKK